MARKYFSLLVRSADDRVWAVEFGDFDRDVVLEERADYSDHGCRASDLKIITSDGKQASIDAAVASLNLAIAG
jgi:hypothetical protein